MQVHLGSLKCTGKVGIYPSDIEQEEKWALENRLNLIEENVGQTLNQTKSFESELENLNSDMNSSEKRMNETLVDYMNFVIHSPSLPRGYKKVKSDFGMVVYKLYTDYKKRPEALKKCTSDASFLHFPQPSNSEENLFYYDLVYPSAIHDKGYSKYTGAMWLDISKANSWSNWAKNAMSVSKDRPYTTMIFKSGERDKNWNRAWSEAQYMFLCTAVFK